MSIRDDIIAVCKRRLAGEDVETGIPLVDALVADIVDEDRMATQAELDELKHILENRCARFLADMTIARKLGR